MQPASGRGQAKWCLGAQLSMFPVAQVRLRINGQVWADVSDSRTTLRRGLVDRLWVGRRFEPPYSGCITLASNDEVLTPSLVDVHRHSEHPLRAVREQDVGSPFALTSITANRDGLPHRRTRVRAGCQRGSGESALLPSLSQGRLCRLRSRRPHEHHLHQARMRRWYAASRPDLGGLTDQRLQLGQAGPRGDRHDPFASHDVCAPIPVRFLGVVGPCPEVR